jgi:hypothetical protein
MTPNSKGVTSPLLSTTLTILGLTYRFDLTLANDSKEGQGTWPLRGQVLDSGSRLERER